MEGFPGWFNVKEMEVKQSSNFIYFGSENKIIFR
jgi:hypothetical protein